MSLQELEPSNEPLLDGNQQPGSPPSRVDWFMRTFPNFFKPEIVEARKLGTTVQTSNKKKPKTWSPVARNVHGVITHVSLYINLKDKSYKLVCTVSMQEWPILEATLLQAVSHGSDWVNVRLGSESLRLKRDELRAAYGHLKSIV